MGSLQDTYQRRNGANILKRFAVDSEDKINEIKAELEKAKVVGADKTSANVNGKKTVDAYQNNSYTFIGAHPSGGQIAQETFSPVTSLTALWYTIACPCS